MKSHASMNRIYRLVFNAALGIWVAVAENAKGRGKGGRAASALLAVLAILSPAAYAANAADATLRGGTGTVATTGNTTTINQASQRLAIDWTQLSTAAGEALKFNQPNAQAIALNRITGSNPSSFLGSLTANGQVFILNPNGILFGAGSQVNVGGIVASTLGMSPTDFMNGSNTFTKTSGRGSVVNQGSMTAAQGGYLALLAPEVRNEGIMTASLGTALLAAGNKITLNLDNGSLLGYSIDEKAIGALVENKHLIKADGGQVILSARAVDALSSGVVNNTGVIEATSLTSAGGKILLEGDLVIQNGTLNASGTSGGAININGRAIIDAGTAKADGNAGSGGSISYSATQAIVQTASARLSANGTANGGTISLNSGNNLFTSGTLEATGQNGGTVDLLGNRVVLSAASADASGTVNGGLIRVGGDFKGANPNIRNAQTTFVNGATTLKANGAGGRVAVWSDHKTNFYGNIIATGNGSAEVSSKGTLTYGGNASMGTGGNLLLDPTNIILDDTAGPAAFALQDPNSFAGKEFGSNITALGSTVGSTFTHNGKVVVAASADNLGGANAGAAYLFDSNTGALISTLIGAAGDAVGNNGVTALTNGNYVVSSYNWNGTRGAATWGSGTTGITGTVSASNSLVGNMVGDNVGSSGITALTNGNYVVASGGWNGNRGAATWGNGTTGVTGAVSAANSLVGSTANDYLSNNGITALTNGNYVVASAGWNGNRGAATWGSGTTGITGAVSASNSLVGSNANDQVGVSGITALTNGNYLVASSGWNGNRGAATWGSGTTGITGTVSAANSLVGSTVGDNLGSGGITALTNGNYVVASSGWNGNRGAATWGSGTTGITGTVSASNSLVGSSANDRVGESGITALSNGNYVVSSGAWSARKGAATWGSGTTGITGAVSTINSLVGSNANDRVGVNGITALTNGNYVVGSSTWNGNQGAATWGSGTTGITGAVSAINSLVGSNANDFVGNTGITALSNGNYVVGGYSWNGNRGAATWGSGTTGITGVVSAANSLVGSTAGDYVGDNGITALTNGNYVVASSGWSGNRGAATWGSGIIGITGAVSAANSLVGSAVGDYVGYNGITALTNGNYAVASSGWNGSRGAATWGSGTTGITGVVSAANSLVGSTVGDNVGSYSIITLSNGNYAVGAPLFNANTGQVLIGTPGSVGFDTASGQTMRINPSGISATLASGTAVTLQASNDITVNSNITVAGTAGGALTLQAGRNINLNSVITTANGNFTASAGDAAATGPGRMAGAANINFGTGSAINSGTGVVSLLVNGVAYVAPVAPPAPIAPATALTVTLSQEAVALGGTALIPGYNAVKTIVAGLGSSLGGGTGGGSGNSGNAGNSSNTGSGANSPAGILNAAAEE